MRCIKSVFPTTLVKICTVCHRFVTPGRPGLRCTGHCREYYHHGCVSWDYGRFGTMCAALNIDWSCVKCTAARARMLGAPLPGWSRRRRSFQSDGGMHSADGCKSKYKSEINLADVALAKYEPDDLPSKAVERPSTSKTDVKEKSNYVRQESEVAVDEPSPADSKTKQDTDDKKRNSKERRKRNSDDNQNGSNGVRRKSSEESTSPKEIKKDSERRKQNTYETKSDSASSTIDASVTVRKVTKNVKRSSKDSQQTKKEKQIIKDDTTTTDPNIATTADESANLKRETVKTQDQSNDGLAPKSRKDLDKDKRLAEVSMASNEAKEIDKEMKGSESFFETIMKEVIDYKRTQDGLINSIMFITSAFYDLSTIMGVMKQNTEDIQKLKEENIYLKTEIKDICSKLESMEQELTSDLKAKKYLGESDENIIMNITTKIRNKIDIQEE